MFSSFSRKGGTLYRGICRVPATQPQCPPHCPRPLSRPLHSTSPTHQDPVVVLPNDLLDRSIESVTAKDAGSFFTYHDRTVKEVLENKQQFKTPEMIYEGKTVFDAINMMAEKKLGALIVHDSEGKACGIFTERDYLNKIAVLGRNSRQTRVKDAMTSPILAVPTTARIGPLLTIMTEKRFRHFPVVDNKGGVIGMISIGDLVKELTEEYRNTIKNLQQFIERTY